MHTCIIMYGFFVLLVSVYCECAHVLCMYSMCKCIVHVYSCQFHVCMYMYSECVIVMKFHECMYCAFSLVIFVIVFFCRVFIFPRD